jgi:PAS domain S-box-containing protein
MSQQTSKPFSILPTITLSSASIGTVMFPINTDPSPDYRLFKRLVYISVATLVLVAISFSVWKSVSEYRLTIRGAELQTRGYASALKEHAERALNEADTALLDVIEHIEERGGFQSLSGKSLHGVLGAHLRNSPQIASIFLVSSAGQIINHSVNEPIKQADVSDRDYFIHHRDNPADNTPFLSKPLRNRINGKWRIILSRPIRDTRGELAGVVAVALAPEYFRSFYSTLDLGSNSKIIMVRRDGALLLSVPFKDSDYETDFKKSHLIRTHLPVSPKGTFQIARGSALLEPNARIISYDSLRKFPVVALANIDKDDVLAPWQRNSYIQSALVATVSAALCLMALILLRHIRRIEDAHRVQLVQQNEIAASAEVWQVTFDSMEEAVWVMDTDQHVLRANKATELFFNITPDRFIGRKCCDDAHNSLSPIIDCPFRIMLETGHRASIQTSINDRWYYFSVDPVKNGAGEITGAIHIVSDITEMKLAEEQLFKREQEFRAVVEHSPDTISRYDQDCRRIYINPAIEKLFGTPLEEVLGKRPIEQSPIPEAALFEQNLREVMKSGQEIQTEIQFLSLGGEPRWGHLRIVPEFDADGAVVSILSIGRDITERKQSEQERQSLLRYFESMDRVNRAIQGTNDLEQMMSDVLDVVLSIFACDRAFLLYPCEPEAAFWSVPMERTKPEYPGAALSGHEIPMTPQVAETLRILLASDGPVQFGPASGNPLHADTAERFGFRCFISMALHPRVNKPWQFGIHHCSHAKVWTSDEVKLLQEIGRRITDALTSLLTHRNLQESERQLSLIKYSLDSTLEGAYLSNIDGQIIYANDGACNSLGFSRDELLSMAVPDIIYGLPAEDWAAHVLELRVRGSLTFETNHKTRENRFIPVEINVKHFRYGENEYVLALARNITDRRRTENALHFISQRGWIENAKSFLVSLVYYLGKTLGVDYVVIVKIDKDPGFAETVAQYAKGSIAPNIRYSLKGTPCENVMGRNYCFYQQGVRQLFPEDALLVDMGVESYAAIPLWDSTGQGIGLIAVMNSTPLADEAEVAYLLQMMATPAAAELEQERSNQILQAREQEFRSLAENLPDNIVRYDCEGRTLYVNPRLEKILGMPAESIIGKSPMENHSDGKFTDYIATLKNVITTGIDVEMEMTVPDEAGGFMHHQIRFVAERDCEGAVCSILAIGRDITGRKLTEQALLDKQQRLSDLALELTMTEDRERRHIATNLHDTIGQDLALTRINLGVLAKASLTSSENKILGSTLDRINSAIKSVRNLTRLISPPILESAGLEAALKWLGRQMETEYGLQIQFLDDLSEKTVPRELRTELYFAARELLINISKHARTDSARIAVARENNNFIIRIADDGIGFDPDSIEANLTGEGGFGLFNIRRRIIHLGGTFEIESAVGTGTRVKIGVPLKENQAED